MQAGVDDDMGVAELRTALCEPETPQQVFERTRVREVQLSRLLIFFISGGLLFMLLPGTFLGVWNLISISGRRAAESISPAWIQAHGHAQVLGWIGSFILGIGYYSIPKLRGGLKPFDLWSAWMAGGMWMTGVLLRWTANVYLWQWRALLPFSAALELAAFLLFFRAVSQHKPQDGRKQKLDTWVVVVIVGTMGLLATLLLNLGGCIWLAMRGGSPAFPQAFDQRFLVVAAWGFMVPFVWGFGAKWLPTFLGTPPPNKRVLALAVMVHGDRDCVGARRPVSHNNGADRNFVFAGDRFAQAVCTPGEASKNQRHSRQLSSFCPGRVRVADNSRVARRLGRERSKS